jgi:hypothetical protein
VDVTAGNRRCGRFQIGDEFSIRRALGNCTAGNFNLGAYGVTGTLVYDPPLVGVLLGCTPPAITE